MIFVFQLLHAALFWIQDFIPTAEFFIYPYLTSRGLLPYHEIIDHHFPGLFFLPLNFYTLGFVDPQSFKSLTLFVILLTSVLLHRLAQNMSKNKIIAAEAILLYSLWQIFFSGSLLWIDLFLPLFLLPGMYWFNNKKYLISGIFFALAIIFKQTAVLPIIFLSIFLLRKPSGLIAFIAPSFAVFAGLLFYFFRQGVLSDFIFWNFTFNFAGYAAEAGKFATQNELLKISFPLIVYVGSAVVAVRSGSKQLFQLAGMILVLALPAFSRFGLEHFQPAVSLFCLLVPLALRSNKLLKYGVYAISFIWVIFFIFRNNPSGEIVNFSKGEIELYQTAKNLKSSGFSLGLLGSSPIIYSQSGALPPGKLFYFPLPWFFSRLGEKQLALWEKDPPDYIIFNPQSSVDGKNVFTSAPGLVEYMQMNYREESVISGNIVFRHI
jgi:hypothetical protein